LSRSHTLICGTKKAAYNTSEINSTPKRKSTRARKKSKRKLYEKKSTPSG